MNIHAEAAPSIQTRDSMGFHDDHGDVSSCPTQMAGHSLNWVSAPNGGSWGLEMSGDGCHPVVNLDLQFQSYPAGWWAD